MTRFQPIYDIAELCARKGLNQAVLCPGSRCAPLTLAFARHPFITTRTFSDERSAAFIALGIAQYQRIPTILLCTSGSAAYNFAPAVAEAFFSETPLIVFTADRPTEWVAQHDGQTIYQTDIFGKHVKRSFQLPQEYEHPDNQWAINRMVNEALSLATQEPRGPVHVNLPFREPLYPNKGEEISFSTSVRTIQDLSTDFPLTDAQKKTLGTWQDYNRILIVGGQSEPSMRLIDSLTQLQGKSVPVVGDIISNLHGIPSAIRHHDGFLGQSTEQVKRSLQPDLLITFGQSVISKNLKTFLRSFAPKAHWHIQPAGRLADTYKSITHVFNTTPDEFLSTLNTIDKASSKEQIEYLARWAEQEGKAEKTLEDFFAQNNVGEFALVKTAMASLPNTAHLHLANSMSVRYANFIGLTSAQHSIRVHVNRGTSGIDGCTSTSVGHALINTGQQHVLITGDLAFFYDRNAFWHNYALPNLKVIVLNNHGGVIFKMIDGPGSMPEADDFFVTQQKLNARRLCEEFGFEYIHASSGAMQASVDALMTNSGKTKVLEIETSTEECQKVFEKLKQKIKQRYEA